MKNEKTLIILGPTASGKTTLAAHVAGILNGEIISADSRQVYRGMDIGTGKDYDDYIVKGRKIPCHLIDIADPGEEYNLFRYSQDYARAKKEIISRGKLPVICGGTGLYLHSVMKKYSLRQVPQDPLLRSDLSNKNMDELREILKGLRKPHNITDLESRDRLIRAIEIARGEYNLSTNFNPNEEEKRKEADDQLLAFGIRYEREILRKRITKRLEKRLHEGMIDEVNRLLDSGLTVEKLNYYGLEYRYVTLFLTGELTYNEMFSKLNTAIHQFSKRQMTWFRKMEREGMEIKWLDGMLPLQSKVEIIHRRAESDV
jgi:tRNA dimethylallyltransferase